MTGSAAPPDSGRLGVQFGGQRCGLGRGGVAAHLLGRVTPAMTQATLVPGQSTGRRRGDDSLGAVLFSSGTTGVHATMALLTA